jgi:3-hydroxyisobutyrate dehydrogenase-like beta-hydroxyacid dehydrogenase
MSLTSLSNISIGFIGLGLMGKPMCRNLMREGAQLVVGNRSEPPRLDMQKEGAVALNSSAEVAAGVDVVILMVADTPAVEAVLLEEGGVLSGARPGTLIIDMGTTLMAATRNYASCAIGKNCMYVDAPVSGGTIGAERGDLTVMAGGSDDAFKLALPVLRVLGDHITHVGPVGSGQLAKAANQVIVGLNIGAIAEALALAKAAGVDPEKVRQALSGGFADSRVLQVHGQRMIDGDFLPGGKATTQRKDMDQAIHLATELGLDLPATRLSRDLYDQLIDSGGANLDHSAIIKVIDK